MEPKDELPRMNAPFTYQEALNRGLSPDQLRSKQVAHVSQSLYRPAEWEFDLHEAARALSAASPGAWISHSTAARLHGLVLPPWLANSDELHLSTPRKLAQMRRKGITPHNVIALRDEVETVGDLRTSSKARTWLDLARILPLRDLVCMGDQLIRIPRQEYEDRSEPFATLDSLHRMVGSHRNMQGIIRAREALDLMRVGADSPPETLLRLAMADANLPEPELQLNLHNRPNSPSADAGYRSRRIALQYDGAHHLDEVQRRKDGRRDRAFEAAGWTVLKFTEPDVSDGFQDAVRRIKSALRRAVIDPTIASGFVSGS
ncbi:DUF559 domain-containing protein [Arthrobacter sp. PAMC 25486]|uniref:DUF559 domain-containing protein n=1 Tax=Arthrobacter sp. PAMC 25486 TaxID=1494608 RepID=UPI00056FC514|nr:DUF559 domain-containing protein [Arthrobacter sp. PAMC 25486]